MAPEIPRVRLEGLPLYAQLVSGEGIATQDRRNELSPVGIDSSRSLAALGCFETRQQRFSHLTSLKYRLFPTSLPFHPIVDPKEFPRIYEWAKVYLSQTYTKITQPTFAQKPVDEILDAVEEFYLVIDYTYSEIYSLQSSSPDQATFELAKRLDPEFTAFTTPFYNSTALYELYQGLQIRTSQPGFQSKYPLDQVRASIENQLISFERDGVMLSPREIKPDRLHPSNIIRGS